MITIKRKRYISFYDKTSMHSSIRNIFPIFMLIKFDNGISECSWRLSGFTWKTYYLSRNEFENYHDFFSLIVAGLNLMSFNESKMAVSEWWWQYWKYAISIMEDFKVCA